MEWGENEGRPDECCGKEGGPRMIAASLSFSFFSSAVLSLSDFSSLEIFFFVVVGNRLNGTAQATGCGY